MEADMHGDMLHGRARFPKPSPLPREVIEEQAVSGVETVAPQLAVDEVLGVDIPPEVLQAPIDSHRFPRTAIVVEMAAIADRLRIAAKGIDHLCATATLYEPSTLRRKAHALVRLAWADIAERVML
ncbi:MAG TPA: hypothetical protein VG937_30220 [Polyangiaceae bacterium]|nr:hypothetical protein [Polyangiaceae bacterium]